MKIISLFLHYIIKYSNELLYIKVSNNKDIVTTSIGNLSFSYVYVADAVSALIKIMLDGKDGEAYNVAIDDESTLKDLAKYIAKFDSISSY